MQINTTAPNPASVRVLLADTGTLLREQVTAMLEESGCELLLATDGFEVLCRLPELRPDVLLIASDLPRLNGIQVCTLLRQSPDFTVLPVVVMTGEHAIVDTVRAKLAGANACLEKPFRRADLLAAFAELFDQATDRPLPDVSDVLKESASHGMPAYR